MLLRIGHNYKQSQHCIFFLSLLIVGFVVSSCENSSKEPIEQVEIKQDSTTLYGDKSFTFPKLTDKALDQITQWGIYEDFESEVTSINGNTIETLQSKIERITSHLDSLSKNIPDTLYTQALYSRIIVIKTRTSLLDQELKKSRIDSIRLQNYINEVNVILV